MKPARTMFLTERKVSACIDVSLLYRILEKDKIFLIKVKI